MITSVPPWFCLLFFFGGALPMSIQSGTCRMINSQVTLYVHTITRNQTRTQAISHNHTNSIYSQERGDRGTKTSQRGTKTYLAAREDLLTSATTGGACTSIPSASSRWAHGICSSVHHQVFTPSVHSAATNSPLIPSDQATDK